MKKINKKKILEFAGKDGIDEQKIKELRPLWKKWIDNIKLRN